MKKLILAVIFLAAGNASAAGFHYCSGKITGLVTRASGEGTQLTLEGMSGWARVGYGGSEFKEMHNRQVSMLLAAYMAGKTVRLEFLDNSKTCLDSHTNALIRYVQFGS